MRLARHSWLGVHCLSVTVHWSCSPHSCPALRGHLKPCWHSWQLLLILMEVSTLWPPYIWKLSRDHLLILHRSLKWSAGGKVFGLLPTWRTSGVTLLREIPYSFTSLLLIVNKSQALKMDSQAKLYLLIIYKSCFCVYTIACLHFFSTFPSRTREIFNKMNPVFLCFRIVFLFMLLKMPTLL